MKTTTLISFWILFAGHFSGDGWTWNGIDTVYILQKSDKKDTVECKINYKDKELKAISKESIMRYPNQAELEAGKILKDYTDKLVYRNVDGSKLVTPNTRDCQGIRNAP